ncbi:MAG: polyphosphate kinase 1 [Gammaproteobacteria bacterium]|nr:polyphosphate kinase 1 [Gammaproteobacteria bacterium]MBL6998793.1 polyphosphate kinase 1 [Gammaproteobacteria bacterium]
MSVKPLSQNVEAEEPRVELEAVPEQEFDLEDHQYYLNREFSWLEFNRRVLAEAENPKNRLLERLKFLAIVSSNIDEFFMKRIGGLKQQQGARIQSLSIDGRTPEQQIIRSYEIVTELEDKIYSLYAELRQLLLEHEVVICNYADLSVEEQAQLREYYLRNIFPLVTPQSVDPAHPFPFISNFSLNLLVTLRYREDLENLLARVKVPSGGSGIQRFIQLGESHKYVLLEDVMSNNLDLLFPKMKVVACETFRVIRNINVGTSREKADDLLASIESEVRNRKFATVVRLTVNEGMDPVRRGMLTAEIGLNDERDTFSSSGMLSMRDLWEIVGINKPELHDEPHRPIDHVKLRVAQNIFHAIRDAGSLFLQHPYESFGTSVTRFVKEASSDPKVHAIKMTLYRTSQDSKIIDYLISAAQNGKQVAVVVELQARFDEVANIRWASRLEEAGIHVTYGVVGLKTHCKVVLVVRKDYSGLRRYAHLGTGNYHAGTARLYTDVGILTCNEEIGRDLTELFNFLTTGFTPKRNYLKILPAPKVLKLALIGKIQREVRHHKNKTQGLIRFKANALEDKEICQELYRASQAGVKIELIIRDTCRIRPGIKGLSDNISVISIVGRFLEHSRIFYFRNGGEEEFYIGSADLMTRNLEFRVEVLTPIEDESHRDECRTILNACLNDSCSAWELQQDGSYIQRKSEAEDVLCAQAKMIILAEERSKYARAHKKINYKSSHRKNRNR